MENTLVVSFIFNGALNQQFYLDVGANIVVGIDMLRLGNSDNKTFCGLPVVVRPGPISFNSLSQATFSKAAKGFSDHLGGFFYGWTVYDGSGHKNLSLLRGFK